MPAYVKMVALLKIGKQYFYFLFFSKYILMILLEIQNKIKPII